MTARNCLITGGSSGIGRATALLAARNGYRVAIASLPAHVDDSVMVAEAIRASGKHAVALQGDVALQADIERIFGEAETAIGPLTALVNCAGVYREARVGAS